MKKIYLFIYIIFVIFNTNSEENKTNGTIWIIKICKSNGEEKTLSNTCGNYTNTNYEIKLDTLDKIKVSTDSCYKFSNIDIIKKHRIMIYRDGRRHASFYFKFEDYKSNTLIFGFRELYEVWEFIPTNESYVCK